MTASQSVKAGLHVHKHNVDQNLHVLALFLFVALYWFIIPVQCRCIWEHPCFYTGSLCNLSRKLNWNLSIQALIDGPCTNVCRKALNFKHLSLTDFKVKVGPSAKSGPVKKAFEKGEILEKWEKTAWAKKLVTKKKRTTLTDFDRFKLKVAKQRVGLCIFVFKSYNFCFYSKSTMLTVYSTFEHKLSYSGVRQAWMCCLVLYF